MGNKCGMEDQQAYKGVIASSVQKPFTCTPENVYKITFGFCCIIFTELVKMSALYISHLYLILLIKTGFARYLCCREVHHLFGS